jgi:NADH dehydrogenase FAD-containing subunit
MAEFFDPGFNMLHGRAVMSRLKEDGIEIIFGAKAASVDRGGARCVTAGGERYFEADTVIFAAGRKPLTEEASALYDCAGQFHVLGDCVVPRTIGEATAAAMTIARDIGRF